MDKYIIKHSHITSKSEQLLKTILENEMKMFENFSFMIQTFIEFILRTIYFFS